MDGGIDTVNSLAGGVGETNTIDEDAGINSLLYNVSQVYFTSSVPYNIHSIL